MRSFDIEAHVGRDLVVAGAPGVERSRQVADLLVQPDLDVGVHVLEFVAPDHLAGGDLVADLLQGSDHPVRVGLVEQPGAPSAHVRGRVEARTSYGASGASCTVDEVNASKRPLVGASILPCQVLIQGQPRWC